MIIYSFSVNRAGMFLCSYEKNELFQLTMSSGCTKSQQNINPDTSQRKLFFLTHEKLSQSNSIVKCTSEFVSPALLPRQLGYFYFSQSRSKYPNERKIDDIQRANGYEK